MPTEQPSNAADAPAPRDGANAAAVVSDEALDTTPGGGGLGGASAADPLAGTAGGGAPDTPFDNGTAQHEAQRQSAETTPSTGGRSSGG